MAPFLSVITRHLRSRPNMLVVNQASLAMQIDPDYEQVIEVDEIGRGWEYAFEMVQRCAVSARGQYVLTLDDDDILIQTEAIRLWKEATVDEPPAVIHRAWHGNLGILPDNGHWRRKPELSFIGMCGFLLRRDVLLENIQKVKGVYESDYQLIAMVYEQYGNQVVWLDELMCWAMRRSFGAGERSILHQVA